MSSLSPEGFQQLLQLIDDAKLIDRVAVGAIALLVYEHLLTLGEEINFMWNGRWGLAKLIFIWNRYFTLLACCGMVFLVTLQPTRSDTDCQVFLQIETGISTLIIGTVDLVLMLRVWILYGGGTKLLTVFLSLLGAEVACMVVIQIFAVRQFTSFIHAEPFLSGCYALQTPPDFLPLMLVPPLAVSVVMCSLTLLKCRRRILALLGLSKYSHSQPVTELFLRDGTFWFIAVFAVDFSQLLIWIYGRPTLFSILIIPSIVIYTILSSRALLNIKHVLLEMEAGRSPQRSRGSAPVLSGRPQAQMSQSPTDGLSPAPSRASDRRKRLQKPSKASLRSHTEAGQSSLFLTRHPAPRPPPICVTSESYRRERNKSGASSIEPLKPNRPESWSDGGYDGPVAVSPTHPSRSNSFHSLKSSNKSVYAHDSRLDGFFVSSEQVEFPIPNYSRPFSSQTRMSA